ncbi:hypothetical protein PCK1_000717 [Pneumocystis canis]|nr:hypothetical protein PCK1_000717 [Pneumocystis canis]
MHPADLSCTLNTEDLLNPLSGMCIWIETTHWRSQIRLLPIISNETTKNTMIQSVHPPVSTFKTFYVKRTVINHEKVPLWNYRGAEWWVSASDSLLYTKLTRWKSKLMFNGDTQTAWILQWPNGQRALLYGHVMFNGRFCILCSRLESTTLQTSIQYMNEESLRRLAIAALRLRGIIPSNHEFQQLVEHAKQAAVFACAYGGLRTDNVLDYFSQSPFYDRHSNNQLLKMQTQFSMLGDLQGHLKKMRGIEFIIAVDQHPDAWVIYKQNRTSENDVSVLAVYFVANESIYMAPSIYSVITSRMLNIILFLRQAHSSVYGLHQFSPVTGHSYAMAETSLGSKEATSTVQERTNQHMFKVLMDAMRHRYSMTAQHSDSTELKSLESSTQEDHEVKKNEMVTVLKKKRKTGKKSRSPESPHV